MQPLVMAHLSELKQSLRCIYTFCLLSVFIFWSTGGAAAHETHLVELRQIAQLAE